VPIKDIGVAIKYFRQPRGSGARRAKHQYCRFGKKMPSIAAEWRVHPNHPASEVKSVRAGEDRSGYDLLSLRRYRGILSIWH
jgi:hypothetical protein